jgi:putative ABC transport system permease protein
MTISVIVLFVGIIILDSYTNSYYSSYEEFEDDTIYVRNTNGIDDESMYYFNNNLENDLLTYYFPYYIKNEVVSNIVLPYIVRGVSSNFINNYLPENYVQYMTTEHPMVNSRTWFEGRTWTSDEINLKQRRIIINYFGAAYLFNNENPINKYIEINGYQYKIIGVIANSLSTNNRIIEINKQLANMSEESQITYPYIEIYMPMTTYIKDFTVLNRPTDLIIKLSDLNSKQTVITNLQNYYSHEIEKGDVHISYKEQIELDIKANIAELKPTIMTILIFVLAISGMMTMNTLFFNIKEKIPEIGIRKAMGATRINIITQIVLEGILYALFSFILGAFISAILIFIAKIIFYYKSIIIFSITLNLIHLGIISTIFILESGIVGIIPAIYGSHMKVVDAVRFE